jgi:ATP phosphoribosyltransferase regulatory subunit HisZ
MSLLDSVLGQMDVASIAQQVGIDPAVAQTALAALGQAHGQDGDTIETAAAQTGLDSGTLNQVLGAIGGTAGLGQVATLLQENPQVLSTITGFLDRDGDGSPVNDLLGMAKGLFGK